jgi:serine/threonine protein kinase
MNREEAPAPHPALLPPGSLAGPWRVVAWAGRGVYGAVYRAVHAEQEHAGPVALKLALFPSDPRFAREAELLRRVQHSSIPRFEDRGDWKHSSGEIHPYLVMEWIEGMPLYDWVEQYEPSAQQVLRLLAQLARALEALHAQGAVHRDVKGANVLVRLSDNRAFLTDFGTCNYPGTSALTPYDVYPGTPAYQSPEAWMFPLRAGRDRTARYQAGPADDLFALGMTGYRLLTGEYLELNAPTQDEAGTWHLTDSAPSSRLVLNPRVPSQLRALILRMLSVDPEQRGTAAALAEALELAAESMAPPAMAPQTAEKGSTEHLLPREGAKPRRALVITAAAGLALLTWAWWASHSTPIVSSSAFHTEAVWLGQADGGTAGLGEAVPASPAVSPDSSDEQTLAEDPLPEPLPGQLRLDANGHCPHKRQVALNGACWVPEDCSVFGGQMYKGRCYVPVMLPGRPPRINPAEQP